MRNPPHIATDDQDDRASNGDAQTGRYPVPRITVGTVNTTVSKAPEMQLAEPIAMKFVHRTCPADCTAIPARVSMRDGASIPLSQFGLHQEIFVTTRHPSRNVGSPRKKPPIMRAAILVAIATYLSIAGVIHVLTSPDATAAVARDISMSRKLAGGAPAHPVPPRSELASQGPERTDNSRKCGPSKAIATACVLN